MKRVTLLTSLTLVLIVALNVFSFININQRFISFLNSSLVQETTLCGEYMERQLEGFENDLNRLLFDYQFSDIFKDQQELEKSKQSLQVFYSKYRDLITNVFIFDNKKNYFGLYINERDQFVIDTFARQRQQQLSPRDKVEEIEGKYLYHYPYFENDQVNGNIIVEVDFLRFANKTFSFYPIGRMISYQWVLNNKGEILSDNFPEEFEISDVSVIIDSIDVFATGLVNHEFLGTDGVKQKVHSAYFPLSIFNKNLGIVFSTSQAGFNRYFLNQNKLVSIFSFVITLGLIVFLLIDNRRRRKVQKKLIQKENLLREVMDHFPVGLMILDSENIIRNINNAAQKMLFVDHKEDLVGQDFSKQFLISNKYLLKDEADTLNATDYLYYEKDGAETVIFRIEETTAILGEELRLIALIDVSSIERSRKQEIAANRAKSDFLASMSHEIRTPMNGILGMIGELMESKLPGDAEDKVRTIKKSSDLLLTIINDILDFSKIEAGKMMLEEIPFRLRVEVRHVCELFRSMAEEKNLSVETRISDDVPDNLIGDPFRLRQVISNLVSNAIKFTNNGRIEIGTELMEDHKGRMQLLFWVEDTGIGIPEEKISTIFGSYNQIRNSASRKFGGTGLGTTISKHLVELMNGEIWVESPSRISGKNDDPGSRFSFTIEVFSNEKLKKQYSFEQIRQLSQITILFLTKESSPEKNSINKILHQFGMNIVTKIYQDSTVDTVIHHLQTKKELYQVVIVADKNSLDGFAMASRLKEEELIDLFPVIMTCGNDQPGNYKISKKLGIDYYLIEPFESKEVFDIMKDLFPALSEWGSLEGQLNTIPSQLNILLAEDNLINQKVAQSIFKNIGYEIEIVSNGEEAVEQVQKNKYDIIFLDLFMPEMDGFEAARKIRQLGIKTPVIAMSADSDDERKAETVLAGMDDYIIKPVKVENMKKLLIKMFSMSVS